MSGQIFDFPRKFPIAPGGGGSYVAPTQQRTCLWPSWLRNDVKRSGNSLWSLVRSTVSSTPPVALTGGRFIEGGRGAMTPKSPVSLLSSSRRRRAWCSMSTAWKPTSARCSARLPLARIYYAVKANPARAGAGAAGRARRSSFDAASYRGSRRLPRRRRAPGGDQLRQHDQEGVGDPPRVRSAACRCSPSIRAEELEKLAQHAPGARVYCRILVENDGADWPLSRKFGTTVENGARR